MEAMLIPKEHIYPWCENVMEVQTPLPVDAYIKTTRRLTNYDGTSGLVDIMEILLKNPHLNVCKYRNLKCIRDGDYVAGICLRKYNYTLEDIIKPHVPELPLSARDT